MKITTIPTFPYKKEDLLEQYIPSWKEILYKNLLRILMGNVEEGNIRFKERTGRDMHDNKLWSELSDDEIEEQKRKIAEERERDLINEAYLYVPPIDPEPRHRLLVVRNTKAEYPEMDFLGGVWILVVPTNCEIEFT